MDDRQQEMKSDCYSDSERAAMVRYQGLKQRLLYPLLVLLTRWGITPNQVTLVSAMAGLLFCPLYLWTEPTWTLPAALVLLALHILIDGIDGPLARHTETASPSGSFTDTMADQLVIAATTITLMLERQWGSGGVDLAAGGIYFFLYTVVVGFAMVRNSLEIPYRFVLRPRNLVYAWIFIESCFLTAEVGLYTDVLFWCCNAVLALHFATGFLAIKERL